MKRLTAYPNAETHLVFTVTRNSNQIKPKNAMLPMRRPHQPSTTRDNEIVSQKGMTNRRNRQTKSNSGQFKALAATPARSSTQSRHSFHSPYERVALLPS